MYNLPEDIVRELGFYLTAWEVDKLPYAWIQKDRVFWMKKAELVGISNERFMQRYHAAMAGHGRGAYYYYSLFFYFAPSKNPKVVEGYARMAATYPVNLEYLEYIYMKVDPKHRAVVLLTSIITNPDPAIIRFALSRADLSKCQRNLVLRLTSRTSEC